MPKLPLLDENLGGLLLETSAGFVDDERGYFRSAGCKLYQGKAVIHFVLPRTKCSAGLDHHKGLALRLCYPKTDVPGVEMTGQDDVEPGRGEMFQRFFRTLGFAPLKALRFAKGMMAGKNFRVKTTICP